MEPKEHPSVQYHLNGFRPGNPEVSAPANESGPGESFPADTVDVLIVGSGPAGLTLAAQLSVFPAIRVRLIEQSPGPLELGRADGIACRSMEMFEAFGFADKVAREAYWVNETTFWRPDADGAIVRADRIQDVEDDLSEMPHTILSQARVHDFYLQLLRDSPSQLEPDYACTLVEAARTDDPDHIDHPVTATIERRDQSGQVIDTETLRARYVIGCDGARSMVRQSMGLELAGESARQLWGVMDVLATTNFPDIRFKCVMQSASEGSLLVIPREGGHMVRLYIELDELRDEERAADRNVTADQLIERARRILSPYELDVHQVVWFSAYEIGQRVCDRFDDTPSGEDPRVFIAGDACHTHSPKAGQGMNVAMADAFNLGWKLALVLTGQADPTLLATYSEERRAKAKELIDFDRDMARLFSERGASGAASEQFQQYFQKHGRYTAGVETRYDRSMITAGADHQHYAAGLVVGKRFHSAPVIRLGDARPMELGHVLKADGRWRLIAFAPAGDNGEPRGSISQLCESLSNDNGVVTTYTASGDDPDSVIDVRVVFQASHRELELSAMPDLLRPRKGRFALIDYEKAFAPDLKNSSDIFDLRGIDRVTGALVVVRPDQHIGAVLPLDDRDGLVEYFAQCLTGN